MEQTDNLTCEIGEEFPEEKKLTLVGDVGEIVYNLVRGSNNLSKNLKISASIVSKIVDAIKLSATGGSENAAEATLNQANGSGADASNAVHSGTDFTIAELSAKWMEIKSRLEKLSSEFITFSEKLEEVNVLANTEEGLEEVIRLPLPTSVNGTRMSPDSFMQVLRYYPVPFGKDRNHEIKLRRRLIMSYLEYNSALRFLSELEQLPIDEELAELVYHSEARARNNRKILMNHVKELSEFHESYVHFIKEYIIALDSPNEEEHSNPEYTSNFNDMISKVRDIQLGDPGQNSALQQFRSPTDEFESAIASLCTNIGNLAAQNQVQQ